MGRVIALVVSATAVVVGAAALGLFLWLRTYAPLAAELPLTPGPGLAANVAPTFGSGGKPVFIPDYRPGRSFQMTFTLANTGRFAVRVLGIAGVPAGAVAPEGVTTLRLAPHDTSLVTVRWRLQCRKGLTQAASDGVRLRYRYLSLFTRTASVELPFAVTLRCPGGPPTSP
ncbi:MAG TPA: hypothetical protein VGK79_03760 [Gaiellaceae bacterium]|jgi:hypothetical protein